MQVLMLTDVFDANRTLLSKGSQYDLAEAVALDLVGTKRAQYVTAPTSNPATLTKEEVEGVRTAGPGSGSGVDDTFTQAQLDAKAVAGTLLRKFYSPSDAGPSNVPVYWSPDANTLEPQGSNVNYQYDTGVVAVSDAADTLLGTYNVKGCAIFTVRALNNHASAALATFIIKEVSPSGRETNFLASGQSGYGTGFPSRDFLDQSTRLLGYGSDEALAVGAQPTDIGQLPAGIEGRATVKTLTARTFKVYARFPTGTGATNRTLSVYAEAQSAAGA